jgi:hypothetical protein
VAALSAVAFLVLATTFANALDLAARLAQTSDSAQGFVAAHAVVRGNILLSGWHFPFNDYYFTDTLPYAALEFVTGSCPFLLVLAPVIGYALFVLLALALSLGRNKSLPENLAAMSAVALVLTAPAWFGNWNPLLMSNMHFASVLLALLALWLLSAVACSKGKDTPVLWVQGAGLVLVEAATIGSDPFSLVFAFGPALAVLAIDVSLGGPSPHNRLALLLLAIGLVLGLALPGLIARTGGFTTESDVLTGVVSIHGLMRNLAALAASILSLFGANPPVTSLTPLAVLLFALHGIGLALAIVAIVYTACHMRESEPASLPDRFLCAGILTVLIACAASAQFGKGITPQNLWSGGPPTRYAMPAFLFSVIVLGRAIPGLLSTVRRRVLASRALMAVAVATIFVSAFVDKGAPLWIADNAPARAARWLESHGLSRGVGEYWSANLITAMSGNAINVRSVVPGDDNLVPYVWSSDANAYAQPPQFAIWQDRNQTGVTAAAVRATYAICEMDFVAGYRIALVDTTKCQRKTDAR